MIKLKFEWPEEKVKHSVEIDFDGFPIDGLGRTALNIQVNRAWGAFWEMCQRIERVEAKS